MLSGFAKHAQHVKFAGGIGEIGRDRLAEHIGQLLQQGVGEGVSILLASIAGRDEEGQHLHPWRRVQHEPGQQGRLTCPRWRSPPHIGAPIRLGAEGCQLSQFILAIEQVSGGNPGDLLQVSRADDRLGWPMATVNIGRVIDVDLLVMVADLHAAAAR